MKAKHYNVTGAPTKASMPKWGTGLECSVPKISPFLSSFSILVAG